MKDNKPEPHTDRDAREKKRDEVDSSNKENPYGPEDCLFGSWHHHASRVFFRIIWTFKGPQTFRKQTNRKKEISSFSKKNPRTPGACFHDPFPSPSGWKLRKHGGLQTDSLSTKISFGEWPCTSRRGRKKPSNPEDSGGRPTTE